MFKQLKKYFITIFLLTLIPLIWLSLNLRSVGKSNNIQAYSYTIKSGISFNQAIQTLRKKNLIRSYNAAKFIQTFFRMSLKKGVYEITPDMSTYEILSLMSKGKDKLYKITFPEGFSILDMYQRLKHSQFKAIAGDFLKAAYDTNLLQEYNIHNKSAEGYLFPSTYHIPLNFTGKKLVKLMIKTFFDTIHSFIKEPLTPEEIEQKVILASIIEKEAVTMKDRPLIASVFYNRLNKGMRLESCATVIYIFEQKGIKKNRVYFKDLQVDSPFNTYKHKGLTPSSISNPGLLSLKASFYPAKTNYLFFVYKGNGEHIFNTNYKDHLRDYKKYIQFQNIKKK